MSGKRASTHDRFRALGVYNPYEFASRFGTKGVDDYIISYHPYESRTMNGYKAIVWAPGRKVNPDSHFLDNGAQAFHGNRAKALPEALAWAKAELWDARTDGEVTVRCKFPSGSAPHVQVTAPLRPAIRGSVDLGGFRWTVRPPTEAPPRVSRGASVGASVGFAVTTGSNNIAIGRRALSSADVDDVDEDEAVIDGPYRTAGEPAAVTAGSLLHVTCFGVVDAAFKKTLETGIRRVYKMFETRAKLNTVIV